MLHRRQLLCSHALLLRTTSIITCLLFVAQYDSLPQSYDSFSEAVLVIHLYKFKFHQSNSFLSAAGELNILPASG
jgi:hypothetical protein